NSPDGKSAKQDPAAKQASGSVQTAAAKSTSTDKPNDNTTATTLVANKVESSGPPAVPPPAVPPAEPTPAAAAATAPQFGHQPLGSASVMASGTPTYVPVPVVTVPQGPPPAYPPMS